MMKIWLKKISYWLPPAHLAGERGVQKTALLNAAVTLIVAFFLMIYGLLFYYLCGAHIVLLGYILSFVLALATIVIYRRSASLRLSINYLIGVSLFSLIYATFFTGGLKSPALIWLVAVPSVGGNLLKERDKLFWGGATSLTFALLYWLDYINLVFINVVPDPFRNTYLFLTLASAMTGGLACTLIFDRDIQSLLEQTVEQESRIRTLLRTVLHDLANPLAILSGATHILQSSMQSTEKGGKWWRAITGAIGQMGDILDKIRDLEKIKGKKLAISITPVALSEAIHTALATVEERFNEKELHLVYPANSSAGVVVLADPVTLTNQVIINLLTNAIKFSERGSSIHISVAKQDTFIRLTIEDHGIGMSRAMVRSLQKTGELTSRHGTDGEKGSGFGLPIIRAFVEMYGGWMETESKSIDEFPKDHGTKFTIYMRAAKASASHLTRNQAA